MLSALRRAWKRYLASIPAPQESDFVPDSKINIEDFEHPPVDPESRQTVSQLSRELTAHLPPDVAAREIRLLCALLKPGVEPIEALVRWFAKMSAPNSKVGGFVVLDWKAREEVEWQAKRLINSHNIALAWLYAVDSDTEWKGWRERGETPVDTPLRHLTAALHQRGLTLLRFESDDLVCAFAVADAANERTRELCKAINIVLKP